MIRATHLCLIYDGPNTPDYKMNFDCIVTTHSDHECLAARLNDAVTRTRDILLDKYQTLDNCYVLVMCGGDVLQNKIYPYSLPSNGAYLLGTLYKCGVRHNILFKAADPWFATIPTYNTNDRCEEKNLAYWSQTESGNMDGKPLFGATPVRVLNDTSEWGTKILFNKHKFKYYLAVKDYESAKDVLNKVPAQYLPDYTIQLDIALKLPLDSILSSPSWMNGTTSKLYLALAKYCNSTNNKKLASTLASKCNSPSLRYHAMLVLATSTTDPKECAALCQIIVLESKKEYIRYAARQLLVGKTDHLVAKRSVYLPSMVQGSYSTNPSICEDNGYKLCLRHVDYRLHADGSYTYNGTIKTTNVLLSYDTYEDMLNGKHTSKCTLKSDDSILRHDFSGFEDLRLVQHDGLLLASGTGYTNKGPQIVLSHVDRNIDSDGYLSNPVILQHPDALDMCEKNWLPYVRDGYIHFIYSHNPLIILQYDGSIVTPLKSRTMSTGDDFRGGSAPVRVGDNYLAIIHEVVTDGAVNRHYFHRFVKYDENMIPSACSDLFVFGDNKVEFASGMLIIGYDVLLTIGVGDKDAYIRVCSLKYVLDLCTTTIVDMTC